MSALHQMKTAVSLLLSVSSLLTAATFTVSKEGSAQFNSIQAAIDQAAPGDEIVIKDLSVYEEQVIIDSTKNGLWLHSVNTKGLQKPVIKFRDTINVNPKNPTEAKDVSTINFDRNGALQILGANGVRIEGIAVNGAAPYTFGSDAVWEGNGQTYPLQHGNGGIAIWMAGDCIIRHCDISNCFFGINAKDRNIGGVFGMYNPCDCGDTTPVIPFSGFAKTGNHVIEHNRIHNNSFGLYFESSWDGGSTIRYNLIYENHHPSAAFADTVKDCTVEGGNFPGGAFCSKDNLLSPLAIHDNTFWHNRMIFCGVWKSGGQHLIFNNIYGAPGGETGGDVYYGGAPSIPSHLDMFKSYANRMHNCVIASQQQAPTASYISITNDFSQPDKEGDITTKPFPASAEIRYLEIGITGNTKFMSTDPANQNFLVPDWADELVSKYILDQGWEASGVKDPDGSRADLGAIPAGANAFNNVAVVRPVAPVKVTGSKAEIALSVLCPVGDEMREPTIVMSGLVADLDTSDAFASSYKAISLNDIHKIPIATQTLTMGINKLTVDIPSSLGDFALFEFVVEGKEQLSDYTFTSAVGFIPYRKMDYYLEVTIQDTGKTKTLTEVTEGEPVNLHIEGFKVGGLLVTDPLQRLHLKSGSLNDLFTKDGAVLDTVSGGLPGSGGDITVVFKKVPAGGNDCVQAAGVLNDIPFFGVSDPITIKRDLTGTRSPRVNLAPVQPEKKRFEVIDLHGRVVKVLHGSAVKIPRNSFGRGIYFIREVDTRRKGNVAVTKRLLIR